MRSNIRQLKNEDIKSRVVRGAELTSLSFLKTYVIHKVMHTIIHVTMHKFSFSCLELKSEDRKKKLLAIANSSSYSNANRIEKPITM